MKYELTLKEEYSSIIEFMEDLKTCNKNYTIQTTHKSDIKSFAELSAKTKIEGQTKKIKCQDFRIILKARKLENGNFKLSIVLAKFSKEGGFEGGSFETLLIKEKKKTELELFEELF